LEKESKDREGYILRSQEYKFKQKFFTFLFFLALSFIFWLLNALDHNYTTNISFPVDYRFHFLEKIMVNDKPQELSLNLSGRGYTLLRNVFTATQHPIILKEITLNYNRYNSDTNQLYVLTRSLKDIIQRQLGTEVALNYISPDTIFYEFSPVERKKVPVEPNVDLAFSSQFMLGSGITSRPESILISGPHILTDTINKVQTIYKKFTKIDKSFSVDLKLIPPVNNDIHYDKSQVTINIPVDKYTESFVMVPIKVINIPDSMEMKTFPASVKINFIVALQNYNLVRPRQFRAIVDYRTITTSINNKLKVTLERQPAFVKSVTYRPKNVDFIIEK